MQSNKKSSTSDQKAEYLSKLIGFLTLNIWLNIKLSRKTLKHFFLENQYKC